jgi:hypothetical protein
LLLIVESVISMCRGCGGWAPPGREAVAMVVGDGAPRELQPSVADVDRPAVVAGLGCPLP